jgi:hypothetical protein
VNDFDRLLETSPHPLTRELLGAALEDAPAASAAPRVAVALGLSLGVAGSPALAASAVAPGALASSGAPLGLVAVAKWLGMGLVAGAVVSGGAAVAGRTVLAPASPAVAVTLAPRVEAPRTAPVRAERERATAATAPRPDETARPSTDARRAVKAPPAPSGPAVAALPEQASALAHEVARIDEARVSLRGGNALAALAALARYDEERQTRVLDREAAVLRIEALRLAGRTTEARAQARRYLERFPSDAHSAGLRELVGQGEAQGIDR